jgi:hypothetical protein
MATLLLTIIITMTSAEPTEDERTSARIAKLIETVTSLKTTWEERHKAEKELKELPAVKVLPALFPHYVKRSNDPLAATTPGVPLGLEKTISPKAQMRYILHRIWQHHLSKEPSPEIVKVLVDLLAKNSGVAEQVDLIQALRYHWTDEAEKPVAKLFRDAKTDVSVRYSAAVCLLENRGKAYHKQVRDYASTAPVELRRRYFERLATPPHARLTGIDPIVVKMGFTLLEDAMQKRPASVIEASFLASHLEAYLGKTFTPNQREEKYQGKNGLNESFFADTVANARAWWAKNKKEYEK